MNGNVYTEKKLEGTVIALPGNSNQLNVRLHIPYAFINEKAVDDSVTLLPDYIFNLRIRIDSCKIQESFTSGKTFEIDGYLTLNHITGLVPVEFTPLPSLNVQDGGFNLNLIMEFNPADFNLDVSNPETSFMIRIGDAPVNKI
jgi:hypothetical protein